MGENERRGISGTRLQQLLLLVITVGNHMVSSMESREFCQWESFEESCGRNDVMLIREATYGRMEMGRCVEKSFGYIGCGLDVLPVMDRKCSGRHDCEFSVTTLHGGHNCPNDLTAYLSISYSCVRVNQCEKIICQNSDFLRLTSTEGYLSSTVTASNGCGSSTCPWQIEAKPGQTVNLTLWSFTGGRQTERRRPSSICRKLATITESGRSRDLTDCAEPRARGTLVYTSESRLLEVQLHTVPDEAEFFLKYEVIGCPELEVPAHSIVERDGDVVTIRCVDEKQNGHRAPWNLTCKGNSWLGEMGYCQGPETRAVSFGDMFSSSRSSTFGVVVVVGLGVVLGVVIGVLMLSITLLYMRRRNRTQISKLLIKQRSVLLPPGGHGQNRPGKRDPSLMEASPLANLDSDVISRVSTDYMDHDYTSTLRAGNHPLPPPCVDFLRPHPSQDSSTVCSEKDADLFGRHQRDHVYETPSMPVISDVGMTQHPCSMH